MSSNRLSRLRRALRRFRNSDDGTLSVETAIILPALCMIYVGAFVWFDAFRMQNVNLKATYTIADMISRETDGLDENYIDGLYDIYEFLTYGGHATQMRVSIVECTEECEDENARVLEVCWSKGSDGRGVLTTDAIRAHNTAVPIFAKGDEMIVAETFMSYNPAFDVGLGHQVFENTVFTLPRMPGQLKFMGSSGDEHCYNN